MRQSILQDRDGFQVREDEFTLPEDCWKLDPHTKKTMTICNLFANHRYSIWNIARALDKDCKDVITVLLNKGIIIDRRLRRMPLPEGIERRRADGSPIKTQKTPKPTIINADDESLE